MIIGDDSLEEDLDLECQRVEFDWHSGRMAERRRKDQRDMRARAPWVLEDRWITTVQIVRGPSNILRPVISTWRLNICV